MSRQEDEDSYNTFEKLHNRYLLWHGSRTTNFAGILSQGLRIAPPEAPSTGYMFGKGVYFADMVSKSAECCFASKSNPVGLLLLCEVALGNMYVDALYSLFSYPCHIRYEKTESEFVTKLPPGKHSTKGVGRTCPDPTENKVLENGLIVPAGRGVPAPVTHTSLLYNEYPHLLWVLKGEDERAYLSHRVSVLYCSQVRCL